MDGAPVLFWLGRESRKKQIPFEDDNQNGHGKGNGKRGIRWRNDGGCVVLGGEPGEGVGEEALLQDGVEFGDAVVEDFGGA